MEWNSKGKILRKEGLSLLSCQAGFNILSVSRTRASFFFKTCLSQCPFSPLRVNVCLCGTLWDSRLLWLCLVPVWVLCACWEYMNVCDRQKEGSGRCLSLFLWLSVLFFYFPHSFFLLFMLAAVICALQLDKGLWGCAVVDLDVDLGVFLALLLLSAQPPAVAQKITG